ncbi:MAG: hypothetical protein Tsb0020_33100 [Haliangiales bacterium]
MQTTTDNNIMKVSKSHSLSTATATTVALAVALGFTLAACGGKSPAPTPPTPPPAPNPEVLIAEALADAAIAEPSEEVDDLLALVEENQALSWRTDENGAAWVQVVTWTSWDGYREQVGQTVPLGREIWVTAAPEVQDFCRESELSGEALDDRLEQLLGLRPDTAKPYFAVMWAQPSELVRPCADPDVTTTTCAATDTPADVTIGTHAHKEWFEELMSTSYDPQEGYPWTRLGYTYDWNPETSERGTSEYLIPAETMVRMDSFVTTAEYCGK